jgi:DNA-binding NarL/FixJ family response regulator
MDRSIENVDNTANELVKFSQEIVSEMDDKYQQLLYLYTLIDEKSDKLTKRSIDYIIDEKIDPNALTTAQKKEAVKRAEVMINNRYKEVFDLYSEGFAVNDIAKTLNIGQGEVKLVLELGKGR